MSRVEECSKMVEELNNTIKSITDRCDEPGFIVQPGEFLMTGIELVKATALMDIAQSLAVIADELKNS